MQNKEPSKAYEDEYLIVIDDPISSFDFENKVGIMSFLNYQLGTTTLRAVPSLILTMLSPGFGDDSLRPSGV